MLAFLTSVHVAMRPTASQVALLRPRFLSSVAIKMNGDGSLRLQQPTEEDMRVLEERQIGHPVSNIKGVGTRCKYGHPMAFAFDPLGREPFQGGGRKSKLESGLFRLSCPHLVKAIDEWEREGAVKAINDEIKAEAARSIMEDDGSSERTLAAQLEEAHEGHCRARHEIIGDRLPALRANAAEAGEEQAATVDWILQSGIAGQTRSKVDIKCVHAQLGDHFCRSESNAVAAELLRRLGERGAPADGCADCHAQCDLTLTESEARARWWYEPAKNKWKLRTRMRKRKAKRAEQRLLQQQPGEDGEAQLLWPEEEELQRDLDRSSG